MARRDVRRGSGTGEEPQQPRRKRRWLRGLLMWGLALAMLGAIALGTAVAMAVQSMPSFNELKETAAGQTIVVRARDGSGPQPGHMAAI